MLISSALVAIIVSAITASSLVIFKDWRLRIAFLATQYLAAFTLTLLSWPLGMSITQLISGWMAGAILGMALISLPVSGKILPKSIFDIRKPISSFRTIRINPEILFYLVCVFLTIVVMISLAPTVNSWLTIISYEQILGGLILIGLGLLQLSFRFDELSTIIGLLTVKSGFEVMYSAQESSILVAGLLAAITLGLSLVGAYMLLAPVMEEEF